MKQATWTGEVTCCHGPRQLQGRRGDPWEEGCVPVPLGLSCYLLDQIQLRASGLGSWGGGGDQEKMASQLLSLILVVSFILTGLPRWCKGKESSCQFKKHRGCRFSPWVGNIYWRRKGQPVPMFLPGKFCGQRSLVGYSPWGHKESDTTEHTCTTSFT